MADGIAISRDGFPIAYLDEGRGRPIVIVHPGSSDAGSWQAVAAALSPAFRVLRFDRRLYGKNGPPPAPHAVAREVEDIEALLGLLDQPAILIGHSSGGVVALEAALHAPSALAGLVIYEPPVAVTEPLGGEAVARARAALDRGDAGAAMAIHLRDIVGLPRLLVALVRLAPKTWRDLRKHAAAQIADVEAIDGLGVGIERYRGLAVPTLLVGGAQSPPNLLRRLEALAAVLPNVRKTVIMAKEGHAAHLSAPTELARLIRDFTEGLARPAAAAEVPGMRSPLG